MRRIRKALLMTVSALSLVGVHFVQGSLNADREALGLTRRDPLENAPPVLAFTTVALGGFRGLIANALWIRTSELQEEGRYFEAVQLADWITKLQPHLSTVWIHQAWNMSYNISVKFPDPEDRWLWVQRGIELLRDQGLKYNPHDVGIHSELARHFHHKMGANLDDAHLLYKARWAEAMQGVLGGGRPDWNLLIQPETEADRERATRLREVYRMDPVLMKEVDDLYGPLEWRLPETHAIYWSVRGLREARGQGDRLMLRRTIFQPMLMAFHRGRMITNVYTELIEFGPNLEMVPNASRAYLDQIAGEEDVGIQEHFGKAHRNFLKDAVYFLYTHGREREARKWFDYIQTHYQNTGIEPGTTMDEYCLARITEDVGETSKDRTQAIVEGLLYSGYYNLAIGEEDRGTALLALAARVHDRYTTKTDEHRSSRVRLQLTPFGEMRVEVLRRLLEPDEESIPEMQDALRARLGLPADFGRESTRTNAPSAGTGRAGG